ncbi:holo-(acyl-carrier protein) synthase, putative [Plasmodium sp. gorilla clade G2]|uniref:holo-(acyl-carrier protein) synthase, putative n=1 Tax=Plasmodium sp. gorilla clade G2 TaxID=880535 RepID=UPI000D226BEA|nr:holo-(acyl-carrier protein) synthase, putative [Plasmodium sp. gorilla clade G2]SOV11495.1 holo-(acyl-carrier protein) synthase, putative [Plasmodium sp. gorilla clade G2]
MIFVFIFFKLKGAFYKILKLLCLYLFLYEEGYFIFYGNVESLNIKKNVECKYVGMSRGLIVKSFNNIKNKKRLNMSSSICSRNNIICFNKINKYFDNVKNVFFKKRDILFYLYIIQNVLTKKVYIDKYKKNNYNLINKNRNKYEYINNNMCKYKKKLFNIYMEHNNILYDQGDNFYDNYESNSFLEINNNQVDIPIDLSRFEKEVRKLIEILNYNNYHLNITFVCLKEMKRINKKHRNKNMPTDVISILHSLDDQSYDSNYDFLKNSVEEKKGFKSGDIYLCPEYINKECFLSRMKYERSLFHKKGDSLCNLTDEINEDVTKESINGINCNNININDDSINIDSINVDNINDDSINIDNINDDNINIDNINIDNINIDNIDVDSVGGCDISVDKDSKNVDTNKILNPRGVNKLFSNIFSVNERLPFYVLHAFVHLMHKDHENNLEEYNEFMDIEENIIKKYVTFNKYTPTFYAHHIIGLGTDILCVYRIYKILLLKNKNKFLQKVLNPFEYKELIQQQDNIKYNIEKLAIYISKKFAAKEAIVKSIGRGLSSISKYGISMNDIEIRNDKYGKPHVYLYNKAQTIARQLGIVKIFLSISDEKVFNNNIKTNNINDKNFTCLIHAQALAVGSNI